MRRRFLFVLFLAAFCLPWLGRNLPAQSDAEIRKLIEAAGGAGDYGGAGLVKVFDRTDVDVEESGLNHIRHHVLTKVLTPAGCRDLSAMRFDYDPATNYVEFRKLRVFRAGGAVEDLPLDRFEDRIQPAHGIYWGMRMKVVPLPRLEKGDAVEVETYKKGFLIAYLDGGRGGEDERYIPPMRGHYYDMILFEEGVPIKEKTYSVHTVRTRPLLFEVYNGDCSCSTFFDEKKYHYCWSKKDLPAVHPEPRSPDNWDYVTKVVMTTVPSWEEKSRWFEKTNRGQFDSNEAIRAKVKEITKGIGGDDAKATALLRWVAANIRYSGLNMGKGEGYTLHPGWMIFEERCGVCKDIAGMLITMMRAAGIPAYPAMTMAGARVERVPADQFNHCVVARKMPDGSYRMYDPTWCPLSMDDWSLAEAEQDYVIGSPEGETLSRIPYHPPEDCLIRVVSQEELGADGTLEGTMSFEGRGWNDTFLRRILAGYNPRRGVRPALEGWLLEVSPRAELLDLKTGDYRDLTKPLRIEIRFRIPRYALVYGDRMEIGAPAVKVMLKHLVRAERGTRSPKRTQPLFLYLAARHDVEETIDLPPGFVLETAPPPARIDNEAACLATKVEGAGRALRVFASMAVKRRSTPPELYPGVYDVMEKLRSFARETITVAARGGHAAARGAGAEDAGGTEGRKGGIEK